MYAHYATRYFITRHDKCLSWTSLATEWNSHPILSNKAA